MTILEPFFREVGDGPGVVCLHTNASASGQWRGLMELLAPRFRVVAPDSYDSEEDGEKVGVFQPDCVGSVG